MRVPSFQSAFTMIEIIISLSLIGLFVAIPILAYSGYIKSSRDIRRKDDVNQLQAALEQYKSRTGMYPAADNLQILQSAGLLPSIPQDPLQGQPIPGEGSLVFSYVYNPSADLLNYQILARLEQKSQYYQATPIGNTYIDTVPGSGLPPAGTPIPQNTLIPSLSAIPTSTTAPTITPTPSTIYWAPISGSNAPAARSSLAYAWTGTKLFIFGGSGAAGNLHDGALYTPSTNTWSPITTSGAPANTNTLDFTAVWTGTKVIVWGDRSSTEGGIYDPAAITWTTGGTATTGAPVPRYNHSAIWTGSKMIVWGGNDQSSGALNSGGVFNPSSGTNGTWTPTSASPLAARMGHTAVWTGTDMIIWGGVYGTYYGDGARYNPSTDTWATISNVNAPSARVQHVAIWTGNKMIVWGGRDANGVALQDGGMYDPVSDSWTPMTTANAPVGASSARALMLNGRLYVWGGNAGSLSLTNTGGIFDPDIGSNGKWTAISTNGAPAGRIQHAFVTNGTKLYVWGGLGNSGILGDGSAYLLH